MTVQVQNTTQYYAGPITKGTILSIKDFTFADNSHVSVKIRNNPTPWRYGVDYTVSGANESDRTLTIQKDVTADEVLAAYLDVPITQDVKPEEGGSFPADVQEYSLDKAIYICQMLQERISRSLQISVDTNFNGTLPELIPNRTFKINSSGTGIILSTYDPDQALVITEDFKKAAEASAAAAKISETNAKSSETNAKVIELATEQIKQETEQIKSETNQLKQETEQIKSETSQIKQDTQAIADKAIQDINTEEALALAAVAASTQDAKDWAIKMDGKVNNEDYSAKYYANEAKILTAGSLNQKQITNCILEATNEVKLELNNGALSLKSGSIVVVPYGTTQPDKKIGNTLNGGKIVDISWDGSKLFYHVQYESDITVQTMGIGSPDFYLVLSPNGEFYGDITTEVYSSDVQPEDIAESVIWYDTTNNFVKITSDSGSSWEEGYSLGLCTIRRQNQGEISGIKEIYDCVIATGSCIFIKKGLKVLIPNGRNADKTLKNIEYVFSKDVSGTLATDVLNQPAYIQVTINDDESVVVSRLQYTNYVETEIQPAASNTLTWYNPETNYVYRSESENWTPKKVVRLGIYIPQSSSSIAIYPFQPFRAVDQNDTEFIAHQAMPSDRYISLTPQASGKYYVAPADGYFTAILKFTTNTAFISFQVGQLVIFSHSNISTSGNIGCYIPVKKGNNVNLQYNGGTITRFSFVYAQGARND